MTEPSLHDRFVTWLMDGAIGEPARDLAVHASVCPACAPWIRAHDALAAVDPGRAPLPAARPAAVAMSGSLRNAGRFAAATGGLLVAGGLLAFGVGRIASGTLSIFPDREQAVLGATGTPAPSATAASVEPSPRGSAAASRSASPQSSAAPGVRAATPRPTVRATPSSRATPGATPTPTPAATPAPTPTGTPPTASATPSPTSVPSASPTPTLPTATPNPSP